MQSSCKICIVDNNQGFRDGLRFIIGIKTNWQVIQEDCSCMDLLASGINLSADVIIISISMPEASEIEAAKHIVEHIQKINIRALAVTMHANKNFVDKLITIGFKGCILKRNLYSQLETAVDTIQSDKLYFNI